MPGPKQSDGIPRLGMLARARNRRGLISSVVPFDGGLEGRVHLVTLEYLDPNSPQEETLLWEREVATDLLAPTNLPEVERTGPMVPGDFDALVRATRWTALSPFLDPADGTRPMDRMPLAAPFHGAIQVEDFQLVPLLKALRMPRVALLLADDVGLGKTVEAGLVLSELILRRRIRRVLILCPASLRTQWRQEMREKFSLSFDLVDRPATHALRRRLGLDANPWRLFPRIITSYDYLKQPDVFEEFRAACRVPEDSPHLPWDLLIADEAHNLAPAPFGEESEASKMLKLLAPRFEHRVFLTATPHNGHTRSFTGLLESLDPVRFSRTAENLTDGVKRRIQEVVVRRLKTEINRHGDRPRFAERRLEALSLTLSSEEQRLSQAFGAFRAKVRSLMARQGRKENLAGGFAVEVLGKRLLSCPVAFADSWRRYLAGLEADEEARVEEVHSARRAVVEEIADDREAEGRTAHAARTVGAWLKPLEASLRPEMEALDRALEALGLSAPGRPPRRDARFDALLRLLDQRLRTPEGAFRADERLVVFTEYKATLDDLVGRLRARFPQPGVLLELYGGMGEPEREAIKAAFNDPADPVRILVATDAASEGLNLQESARYLLHYDIPWNPTRLEQRNGRLDRHGQARDVTVFHFHTEADDDLAFLAYVAGKVHTIREDLGSTADVFDRAVERRLVQGASASAVRADLEADLHRARGRAHVPRLEAEWGGQEEREALRDFAAELDLDPPALRETLEKAMGMRAGLPRLAPADEQGRQQLVHPIPGLWAGLVDDTLRLPERRGVRGVLPGLVFDPERLVVDVGGRPIFRPRRDTALLHLGHPLFHAALAAFARERFPGESSASRWSVRRGPLPEGAEALVLLTLEELAVNDLREGFHHWVRTVALPVRRGDLAPALPHRAPLEWRSDDGVPPTPEDLAEAREIWLEIHREVRAFVDQSRRELTERLRTVLQATAASARKNEEARFKTRHGEVSSLIENATMQRLERELAELRSQAGQGLLFDEDVADLERSTAEKEAELRRRREHYVELRDQLERERTRVLTHLLPRRYEMRGEAQVFPVALEIRLPEVGR